MSEAPDYAALDYEPTPEEVRETFAYFDDAHKGAHGNIVLLPTMERYIWAVEGILWGHRTIREDGMVEFFWLRPGRRDIDH